MDSSKSVKKCVGSTKAKLLISRYAATLNMATPSSVILNMEKLLGGDLPFLVFRRDLTRACVRTYAFRKIFLLRISKYLENLLYDEEKFTFLSLI